uniref:RdRp n=1 Tax=Flavolineata virus TaxID=2787848 RepID=A0A7S8C0S2_9VIRU|nr:RdRp [Flavolineata virus]
MADNKVPVKPAAGKLQPTFTVVAAKTAPEVAKRVKPGGGTTKEIRAGIAADNQRRRDNARAMSASERRESADMQKMEEEVFQEQERETQFIKVDINLVIELARLFKAEPVSEEQWAKQLVALAMAYNGNHNGQAAKVHADMTAERRKREQTKAGKEFPTHLFGMELVPGRLEQIELERSGIPRSMKDAEGWNDPIAAKTVRLAYNAVMKAGARAHLFLRRVASFIARPSEMLTDEDHPMFPKGPFWCQRALRGGFLDEGGPPPKRGRKAGPAPRAHHQNMMISLPSDIAKGQRTQIGAAAGNWMHLLALFSWGLNSASLIKCVAKEGAGWVLTGIPLQRKEIPTLIVGSHGMLTRNGSGDFTGCLTVKTADGTKQIEDDAVTNLANWSPPDME